jgi:hypothetical protein
MKKQNRVYLLAGLTSVILYMVGVFTGAIIYNYAENKAYQELSRLDDEISGYNKDLEAIEFQQLYLTSDQELGCKFIIASLNNVHKDLGYFWSSLPEKLEIYEKYYPVDENYQNLKKKYMTATIKAWLLSLSVRDKCNEDITPILYFYSADCDDCIEQGYILDTIKNDTNAMVYTVDINLELEAIKIIKDSYKIGTVPTLLINDKVYPGLMKYEKVWELVMTKEGLYF